MEVLQLLSRLASVGAKISVSEDNLMVSVKKGALSAELTGLIRQQKQEIIDFIKAGDAGIQPASPKEYYPLSSAQKRLYVIHQLDNASLAYNDPLVYRLEGSTDRAKLLVSFLGLIERHEALRTCFAMIGNEPRQKIMSSVPFGIADITASGPEDAIRKFIQPFDLTTAPLMRVGLYVMSESTCFLLIDIHHIISDGISKQILLNDFVGLYGGLTLNPLSLQYKDYAEWQQKEIISRRIGKQKEFWLAEFSDEIQGVELPADFPRQAVKDFKGDTISFSIGPDRLRELRQLARTEGTTLFTILLSAYFLLLEKLSGQKDIVVGVSASGRTRPELDEIMGLFINTVPVRIRVPEDLMYKDFLALVNEKALRSLENQEFQYEQLVDELKVTRDPSHNPLFDIMFMYHTMDKGVIKLPGLTVESLQFKVDTAKFDLTIAAQESEGEISITMEYATSLFARPTAEKFVTWFSRIVDALVADPKIRVGAIDILSGDEKDQLIREFNDCSGEYPAGETIVSLFHQQVRKEPDRSAMVFGNKEFSYKTLDQLSDKVACRLTESCSIGKGSLVSLMAERSEWMIVGILGILKSGAAYVPIDPVYPRERVEYILQDSRSACLLLGGDPQEIGTFSGPVLSIRDIINEPVIGSRDAPTADISPEDLCYLIYTSGSTGLPKGVMIAHRNVVNFFHGMSGKIPVDREDRLLAITSLSFDISVLELLWTLCNGIETVIHPSDTVLGSLDRYVPVKRPDPEFSLFFFSNYVQKENKKYEHFFKAVQYADLNGFKAVWVPERHFHSFGGLYPNPLLLGSALAVTTKNVHIRFGSVVAPLHHEIRLSEDLSVLDNLAEGRIGVSFAPGWNPNDFVLASGDYTTRYRKMYEQIEVIKRLWSGQSIGRTNGLDRQTEITTFPRPVQQSLPIWITSGGSEEAFVSAGSIGANLLTHLLGQEIGELERKIKLYRQSRESHGFAASEGKVTLMVHTYIGRDSAEVEDLVEGPFIEYLKSSIGLSKLIFEEAGLREEDLPEETKNILLKNAFKRYYKTASLIGTKETCWTTVNKLIGIGVNEIACLVDFGLEEDVVLDGLHHLNELRLAFTESASQTRKPVTMLQSTPSYLKILRDDPDSGNFLRSVKTFLVGGEPFPLSLAREMATDYHASLFNLYGPTETTIWSGICRLDKQPADITIGRPILNTQFYVLNAERQLVPPGVRGDLYIGGNGVAKGYWNKPELTRDRFIPNPFRPGEKIYMTGDVAKWRTDGKMELLGRKDHQIKWRGYRIELGEIENTIAGYPGMEEAVVKLVDSASGGEKIVAAYIVSATSIDVDELKRRIALSLPHYMVPQTYIQLDRLPLTPNGKVDRNQLPEPTAGKARDGQQPMTPEERLLVRIWQKVLNVQEIGLGNNFFSLGGDSIRCIQVLSRLKAEGYEVTLGDVFIYQTIPELSRKLKRSAGLTDQGEVIGLGPLSPIQKWLISSPIRKQAHFNQSVVLTFPARISLPEIRAIFEPLLHHHDALRTVIETGPDRTVQHTKPFSPDLLTVWEYDLSGSPDPRPILSETADRLQASIELGAGPLIRLGLFHLSDESRLLIVIHHLVTDGISWRILFEDIETLYSQVRRGASPVLPEKTVSFQTWCKAVWNYANSRVHRQTAAYWKAMTQETCQPVPRDNPTGRNRMRDRSTATLELSAGETTELLLKANKAFHTQINDILLSALALSLYDCLGLSKVCVEMEGHGREGHLLNLDCSRTVGWFTTMFRVALGADPAAGLSQVIKETKERLNQIPHKGFDYLPFSYPEEGVATGLAKDMDKSHPQLFFNYLGQFDSDISGLSYSLSEDLAGKEIDPEEEWMYDWDMMARVMGGRFRLNLTYNNNQYKDGTITSFLQSYKDNLVKIIHYCGSRAESLQTPSDFTYKGLTIRQTDELQAEYRLQNIYLLSPMQEALLFHHELDPDSGQYFLQITHDFHGPLDLDAIRQSLRDLAGRYDVLRTNFLSTGYHSPIQIVGQESDIPLFYQGWYPDSRGPSDTMDSAVFREDRILAARLSDRSNKFDLANGRLMRLSILETGSDEYHFIWSYHHIIMDGWCIGIVIEDFKKLYAHHHSDEPLRLPPVKPYWNYIEWLDHYDKEEAVSHWRNYLADYQTTTGLPAKRDSPADGSSFQLTSHHVQIDEELTRTITACSGKTGVTANTIFQTAWGILLSKYNFTNDVVFGSVIAGRPTEIGEVEKMVGLFINTVPIRVTFMEGYSAADLLKIMQDNAVEFDRFNYLSLNEIQSLSPVGRQLLDHILIFENYPVASLIEQAENDPGRNHDDYSISNVQMFEQNNYLLSVSILPGKAIQIRFDYNAEVYAPDTIASAAGHFTNILRVICLHPETKLSAISLASVEDIQMIHRVFDHTSFPFDPQQSILSLFRKQAAASPAATAATCDGCSMSYSALDELSSRIAAYLRDVVGIERGDLVGIMLERELYLVPLIFGVLRAGAAYVPIDPGNPEKRKSLIIDQSGMKALVSREKFLSLIRTNKIREIDLDVEITALAGYEGKLTNPVCRGNDLAYVIYTSESTGHPKGVMIEHRSVVNRIQWMQRKYPIGEGDIILQKTALTFDVSGWELFWPSFTGASTYLLAPGLEKDPEAIIRIIDREKITITHFLPSVLEICLASISPGVEVEKWSSLRLVFCSGEVLTIKQVRQFGRTLYARNSTLLIHLYGPIEATVDVSYYECTFAETEMEVPIGKPIDNVSLFVTDNAGNQLPAGMTGELAIGGACLARGYLHNEELTNQRFVTLPAVSPERLFKSGDLAKWLPDGNMLYLGRIDDQVKLRGYRVELREIESILGRYEGIRSCAVVLRESNGGKQLIAYYASDTKIGGARLRSFLAESLPEYMLPAAFIHLSRLPVTANGKPDKQSLPDPARYLTGGTMQPRTKEEKLLAEVWAAVLGVSPIGINDNYFSIGGDSIRSMQICSRLRKGGYDLAVRDIFKNQTIMELVHRMKPIRQQSSQLPVTGTAPLGPAQQWYLDGSLADKQQFGQSVLLQFDRRLEREQATAIFNHLLRHHDALRTIFKAQDNGLIRQYFTSPAPPEIVEWDLPDAKESGILLEQLTNDLLRSMDLENGPLVRIGLFQLTGVSLLFIAIHHLVTDGVSWRILLEDIDTLYRQLLAYSPLILPVKTGSYQDWVNRLQVYKETSMHKKALTYWRKHHNPASLSIRREDEEGRNPVAEACSRSFRLSGGDSDKLIGIANVRFATTAQDILLSALLLATGAQYKVSELSLDLEGHGREVPGEDMDLTRTVGWFTCIYPVRLRIDPSNPLGTLVATKESLRSVPNGGIDYLLDSAHSHDVLPKDSRPGICFNYLGQFDGDLRDRSFTLATGAGAETISPLRQRKYDWEINVMLIAGCLEVSLVYSPAQYGEETIGDLMRTYEDKLVEMIALCSADTSRELTPSDLTFKEFDPACLKSLQTGFRIGDIYPLTPAQEGMLYHHLLDPASDQYFQQISCRIEGHLDTVCLRRSLSAVMARHDALRTIFYRNGADRPVQVVLREQAGDFEFSDLRGRVENDPIKAVEDELKRLDKAAKFDLYSGSLFRVKLFQLENNRYFFLMSHHHIIMDGWCMGILLRELMETYEAFRSGSLPLPGEIHDFSRYITWLEGRETARAGDFWDSYLKGYDTLTRVPPQKRSFRGGQRPFRGENFHLVLDRDLTKSIRQLSIDQGVTLSTIFHTAWAILLAKYNNATDVVFGSVFSGRPAEIDGIEAMVGLFINTVPIRVNFGENATIASLLAGVQENMLAIEPFSYYPLSTIQSRTAMGRDLIDHIMVFENYPLADEIEKIAPAGQDQDDYRIADFELFEQTNYDLTIKVVPSTDIHITLAYNALQFEAGSLENIIAHLTTILTAMTKNPEQAFPAIDLLPAPEKTRLLDFNNTASEYPRDSTVIAVFRQQALASPDAVAIGLEDRDMTYGELLEWSTRFAHYLRQHFSVSAGDLVGILLEREEFLIPGIFGIMMAGAAYVPIDPLYPRDRIRDVIEDSRMKLIVTRSAFAGAVTGTAADLIDLDKTIGAIGSQNCDHPMAEPGGSSLAYVIYTSGSTGKPKGVMIEHHAVVNRLLWMQKQFPLSHKDVLLQKTPIVFDVSVWELLWWAFAGASVCLLKPGGEKDPSMIVDAVARRRVSVIHFVPAMLKAFLGGADLQHIGNRLSGLRLIFCSGEELTPGLVNSFRRKIGENGRARLINLYGPTEATVDVSWHECDLRFEQESVPIGRPIDNIELYVCDGSGNLSPIGIPGELYIAGAGLARGYLNNEALTREKFIQSRPLGGKSLYRTGDWARWLPNGEIEYLGRKDSQVKIRGFRIELGEIEQQLRSHEAVTEAIVNVKERADNKVLVAYFIADKEIQPSDLRSFLSRKLPEYMVPSFYLRLGSIPLTTTGKLDRKALPDPEDAIAGPLVEPQTATTKRLVEIWSDVLEIPADRISPDANFFDLGGHSISLITLNTRLREEFAIEIPLVSMFELRTVTAQEAYILNGIWDQDVRTGEIAEAVATGNDLLQFVQDKLGD